MLRQLLLPGSARGSGGQVSAGLKVLLAQRATDDSDEAKCLSQAGALVRGAATVPDYDSILAHEAIDVLILDRNLAANEDHFERMLLSPQSINAGMARIGVIRDVLGGSLLIRLQASGVVLVRAPSDAQVLLEAIALACTLARPRGASPSRVGSFRFDALDGSLLGPDGRIQLYSGERAVLQCLLEADEYLSADTIAKLALGRSDDHGASLAREYIRRLRRKLAYDAALIKHVRGRGYRVES